MRGSPTATRVVRAIAAVLVTIALAAATAGCGSASDDATEPADGSDDAAAVEATPQTGSGSPLEQRLGFPSDPERRQYRIISLQRQADRDMVACMKAAGFYYAVRPAEDVFRSGAFVGDGTRTWTEQNGLGITSSFGAALAIDAAADTIVDPATSNSDYVASLTPEQALAYDLALVGESSPDPTTGAYEPGGCFAASFTEILQLLSLLDVFEDELAGLNSRLSNDPRVVDLQAEWSQCMAEAGYEYTNENALVEDVYARLLEIELVDQGGVTRIVSSEALDELAAFEQEVAVAAFDCRQGIIAELDRLRFDYEREFLDDNRFRLAELLPPGP